MFVPSHAPVLVPGVSERCDEAELDEDEGKSSHHSNVVPRWGREGGGEREREREIYFREKTICGS